MRIFVSSPSDLAAERRIAVQIIGRLRSEFQHHFAIHSIVWEHEPLLATAHFQEGLVSPADCDIVICMFWSTLGSPLPPSYTRDDGTSGITGSEWEFHLARRGFLSKGKPDILVYRKTRAISLSVRDHEAIAAAQNALAEVDRFFQDNFHNPDADRTFKGAYWPFEDPSEFERQLFAHLSELLRRAASGRRADRTRAVTWFDGSPFRGLASFEFRHAEIFFGRSAPRNEILQHFRDQLAQGSPFVMVTGGSGTGKSSLVKAGLLPILTSPQVIREVAECRWCVFKPSEAPGDLERGLAAAIAGAEGLHELGSLPNGEAVATPVLVERIHAALEAARASASYRANLRVALAIVIDQFEELFSHPDIDETARRRFVQLLSALVTDGGVWIIGTMRSDFLEKCEAYPELMKLMRARGQFQLGAPAGEELDQIIRLPARAAGLDFEVNADGIGLDSVLREAAGGYGALPLLSFTLEELYSRRTAEGMLTFAAYQELGGLEGAITCRASQELAKVAPQSRAALPQLLGSLITIQEEDTVAVARNAAWDYVSESEARLQLAEAFVRARLLTQDPDRGNTVRLAHESLLTRWAEARDWIRDNKEFLRARARVSSSAAYWNSEERGATLLIPEGRLLERAEQLLYSQRLDLSPVVVEYIEASLQERAKRRAAERDRQHAESRRRLHLLAGAVGAGLAVIAAVTLIVRSRIEAAELEKAAQEQSQREQEIVFRRDVEESRRLVDAGNYLDGTSRAITALARNPAVSADAKAQAHTILNRALFRRPDFTAIGTGNAFIPNTNLLWSGGKEGKLGEPRPSASVHWQAFGQRPVAAPNGTHVLGISPQGELELWRAAPLQRQFEFANGADAPHGFSEDNTTAFVARGRELQTFMLKSAAQASHLMPESIREVRMPSADTALVKLESGRTLLCNPQKADRDCVPLRLPVWSSDNRLVDFVDYTAEITRSSVASFGAGLLTTSRAGENLLWDATAGTLLSRLGKGEVALFGDFASTADGYALTSTILQTGWSRHTYVAKAPIVRFAVAGVSGARITLDSDGILTVWHPDGSPRGEPTPVAGFPFGSDMRLLVDDEASRIYLLNGDEGLLLEHRAGGPLLTNRIRPVAVPGEVAGVVLYRTPPSNDLIVDRLSDLRPARLQLDDLLEPIAMDASARRLALAKDGAPVQIWSLAPTKTEVTQLPSPAPVTSAEFSVNGRFVLLGTKAGGTLWDVESASAPRKVVVGGRIASADANRAANAFAFGYDSRVTLRLAGTDRTINLAAPVTQVKLDPDGTLIAIGLADGTLQVQDIGTGKVRATHRLDSAITGIVLGPAGSYMIAWQANDNVVHVWPQGVVGTAHSLVHWGPIQHVAVDPESRTILTSTTDGSANLWNGRTGAHVRGRSTQARIDSVSFQAGKPVVYASEEPKSVMIMGTSMVATLHVEMRQSDVAAVTTSYDGRRAIVMDIAGEATIWDIASGKSERTFDATLYRYTDQEGKLVTGPQRETIDRNQVRIALSRDAQQLAVQLRKRGMITAFDLNTGKNTFASAAGLELAGFDLRGELLIARTMDRQLRSWNVRTGSVATAQSGVQPLIYTDDTSVRSARTPLRALDLFSDTVTSAASETPFERTLSADSRGRLLVQRTSTEIRMLDPAHSQAMVVTPGNRNFSRALLASDGSAAIFLSGNEAEWIPLSTDDIEQAAKRLLATR